MRLSQWRKSAPTNESMSERVLETLKPVLLDLGDDADPDCWITWGDDPGRYSVLAPTVAGLVTVAVRVGSPVEGPRANGKLIRWPKLTVSELNIEATGGHRVVAVQIENIVLKGVDQEADRICVFVRELVASIDGRTAKPISIAVAQGAPKAAEAVAAAAPQAKVAGARPAAAKPRSAVAPASARRVTAEAATGAPSAVAPRAAGRGSRSGPGSDAPQPLAAPKPPAVPSARPAGSTRSSGPAPESDAAVAPALAVPPAVAAPASAPAAGTSAESAAFPALPSGEEPILARASTESLAEPAPRGPEPAVEEPVEPVKPEVELPEWISPHPIEEPPAHGPTRPRPWMP